MELRGKKVAILVDQIYQDLEVWYPYYRLKEAGAEVVVVGAKAGETYHGKYGYPIVCEKSYEQVTAGDFDGVVVPGGYAPDLIRRYGKALQLVKDLDAPMKMELFVGDADGRNARQITNFGCASFAPTFTPDGKKILFASNKHACDTRNFELYLVNLDGSGLEPVTSFGGFTSFPEFSPDGKRLAFTSDWKAKDRREFNIFVAEWK
jgi:hypothetical protein